MVEKMIKNDIMNTIINIKGCHSKSMYDKYLSDLSKLYDLAYTLNIDNVPDVNNYTYVKYNYDENKLIKKMKNSYINNFDFNNQLVNNYKIVINDNLDRNFEYDLDFLNYKESQNQVEEFLNKFDKKMLITFRKIVKNNHVLYVDNRYDEYPMESDALTYYGYSFEPYVLIDDYNSILTSHALVHEIAHVHDYNNLIYKSQNYTIEIYSYFMELVFMNYLKNDKKNYRNIFYQYIDNLEESIDDLTNILKINMNSNKKYKENYGSIYYHLEYTYGMILALKFYDEYLQDKEKGIYLINKYSYNKNDYNDYMDLINKFNFDKDELLEGKILKKEIKNLKDN